MNADLARAAASMGPTWSAMAAGVGGRTVRRPGVLATIVPGIPDRSLPNSVLYDDPGSLREHLDELEADYAAAGVRAWTVWALPGDEETAALLARRGHVLDATPAAMVLELDALAPAPPHDPGASLGRGDAAELGRLNDEAYGVAAGTLAPLVAGMGAHLDVVLARLDGRAVAGAATFTHGDDAELFWVATAPAAQRRGLGGAVVHRALTAAAARGARRSTLQATKAGEPVYERLGYRGLGSFGMWERREP